jgi:hypothetical protein
MTIVRNGILIFGTHIHAFEILTTVGLKSDNLNLDCLILIELLRMFSLCNCKEYFMIVGKSNSYCRVLNILYLLKIKDFYSRHR